MRLPGVRGEPAPREAREALLEAVRLGIDLIDTARAYGRSEEMIADALHPYPEGLVIATKGGLARGGDPDGRPERLRADCETSLRRLRVDRIDLWQLHPIDPGVPLEEQFGDHPRAAGRGQDPLRGCFGGDGRGARPRPRARGDRERSEPLEVARQLVDPPGPGGVRVVR